MPKIILIAFSCFLLFASAHSQVSEVMYPDVPAQVSFKAVTDLSFKQPDFKIPYGEAALQYGLLWQAELKPEKALIVLIHGGCWLNAYGVDHSFPMATALAQAGHPVWSLEYRRTGDDGGGWPGSFEDIKLALNNIEQLQKYQVNTNSIILMGHSAGGHLALLAASELTDINFDKIIGLAAITDISRYALGDNSCQQATINFMNGLPKDQIKAYQRANLIHQKIPNNVILMQGKADGIVPIIQSKLPQTQRIIVPKAGHFDWVHPGSPAFRKLLEVLNP